VDSKSDKPRIKLVQTCSACPEQYDGYFQGKKIGYFRLRWGHFCVEYVSPNDSTQGIVVYDVNIINDMAGCFENENQRRYHLNRACQALLNFLEGEEANYEIVSTPPKD
jgi:hypothetical protein